MKIVLAVPFRAAANSRGGANLALAPLAKTTPLALMAARFPELERHVAASSFKLTDELSTRIRAAGFRVVEGDDLDLLGRLLAVAEVAGADAILRVPVESMWLDASILAGDPAAIAAGFGLAAELLPVERLRLIERRPPPRLDRERPQRLFAAAPGPRLDARRIALESESDLDDAAELISSGRLRASSPLAEVVAAYAALDRERSEIRPRHGRAAASGRGRRVVFISGISHYGGSEEFLRETIAWTREIAEVEAILPGPGVLLDKLASDGVPHRILPVPLRRFSPPGRFARDIERLSKALVGAGLVVAKNFYAPQAAIPAARASGAPVWTHLHAILTPDSIRDLAIDQSDLVIGDSRAVIEPLPPGKGVVLPNGVDLERWTPDGERAGAERPRMLLAARAEPHKGHETLIAAAEILARERLDFELALVGAATDPRSASFAEKIRRRLESGALAERHILRGWSDDLRAEMRQAALLVIPTLPPGEPFGRVGIYAMAMGLPVVASDRGGPRDYVKDGETGRLVAPDDPAALAAALRPLITDAGLRARMGAQARMAARAFALTDVARRWREMVERCLTEVKS